MTADSTEAPRRNTREDTLEEQRNAILDEMLGEAAFDGWTLQALEQAARNAGLTAAEIARGDLELAFPKGITDMLDFWAMREDARMLEAFEAALEASDGPTPQKIREKVRFLVHARISGLTPHREAARRAAATLALPIYAPLASRLTWRTADTIWRALGDISTDYNFYTKRATLSGVYLSTLTRWFADEPAENDSDTAFGATWDFLDERIENVMQFEKTKAQVLKQLPKTDDIFAFLSKMRYGNN